MYLKYDALIVAVFSIVFVRLVGRSFGRFIYCVLCIIIVVAVVVSI